MKKARKISLSVTAEGGGGGGDNKWKSARSTLEVRKNTIFFIEKY